MVTLYASFWILVDGLGLASSKAPVAIPVILGFGATMLVKPSLPSRAQILDGAAKLSPAALRRYLRREAVALILAAGVGILVLARTDGALLPVRSEVQDVRLNDSGTATIRFERKLAGAPPFVRGLLASLAVVAFGTAFAAASGAYRAWSLRDVVRGMSDDAGPGGAPER